jgi:hypothetical protein
MSFKAVASRLTGGSCDAKTARDSNREELRTLHDGNYFKSSTPGTHPSNSPKRLYIFTFSSWRIDIYMRLHR